MYSNIRLCLFFLTFTGLLIHPLTAEIGWSEAVTRLNAERAKAIACARLLKKLGGEKLVNKGELSYATAKADMDGVISGLVVAIAQENDPETLPELEARLTRGVEERIRFCGLVEPLVEKDPNEKNFFIDFMANTIGPAIEALKELFLNHRSEQAMVIKTIQAQLEAAKWPDYSRIEPKG